MSSAALEKLWRSGQQDRMSPWECAKAIAFREASKEIHGGVVNFPWILQHLKKNDGSPVSKGSLSEFYAKGRRRP